MMIHRWLEKPRALAALTLAFALVPVVFAYVTFRAARERDAKLAETATQVLGEQLSLSTFKHVSFLNILRNQWRYVADPAHPLRSHLPPPGWMDRFPHLRAVAFVMHEDETRLPIRWQEGRSPMHHLEDNLADDPVLADAMKHARLSSTPVASTARVSPDLLAVVHAVPRENDTSFVRGYLIAWIDLGSMCRDTSLPLLKTNALHASTTTAPESKAVSIGEGDTMWTAWIARGPGFTREYGTPTPWIGFGALGISVLPLSVLVMLASRAGKFRAALEAEREVVRLRTHFLHSVSHEFRTPLSVIQSAIELIEHYADQLPPERRAKALAQINDSTRHMNEMVEQVLTLSRIESHQMPVNVKPLVLRELHSEIVRSIRTASRDRCPIELQCEESLEIHTDAFVLRSILINLIGNAVKYSRDGSTVTVEADVSKIIVRDQGCGIPADDLPLVCDPFHRGSNIGDTSGTGLGLAIASKCAELLGGTLHIDSTIGEGTTATLHLTDQES